MVSRCALILCGPTDDHRGDVIDRVQVSKYGKCAGKHKADGACNMHRFPDVYCAMGRREWHELGMRCSRGEHVYPDRAGSGNAGMRLIGGGKSAGGLVCKCGDV